jgi:hypothetical protein
MIAAVAGDRVVLELSIVEGTTTRLAAPIGARGKPVEGPFDLGQLALYGIEEFDILGDRRDGIAGWRGNGTDYHDGHRSGPSWRKVAPPTPPWPLPGVASITRRDVSYAVMTGNRRVTARSMRGMTG